eukprot:2677525-Rhodomonas_salina.1
MLTTLVMANCPCVAAPKSSEYSESHSRLWSFLVIASPPRTCVSSPRPHRSVPRGTGHIHHLRLLFQHCTRNRWEKMPQHR